MELMEHFHQPPACIPGAKTFVYKTIRDLKLEVDVFIFTTLNLLCQFPMLMGPIEHGGQRADGQPDKRTQQSQFAYGKLDPHQAGQQGCSTTGAGGSGPGEFAHGAVDPYEAGRAGGSK